MNIIIPLGGKGERFSKNGYTQPKPLIPIFEKKMIDYVIDNLNITNEDKIFIIYNSKLDNYNFSNYIKTKYSFINLIKINDTKGAVETLFLGINDIINNDSINEYSYNDKCLILDCDTFYTQDIINIFKNSNDNMVFYTKNYDKEVIYSYIELNEESKILNIREKEKISDNANTGAYAFTDINLLYQYCKYVLDNNITFNNEPYTSCVISEMLNKNIIFKGHELKDTTVFSLGTPLAVKTYVDNTIAFLFDLDGTLVITDNIYYHVWDNILMQYNIVLNQDIFQKYIQGNNDKYVLNTLLKSINISSSELSKVKDDLFIKNIQKIKIIDGVYDILNEIKLLGYKICIVTNCNKNVAHEIVKYINIDKSIDFIISSDDCINGKPNIEPYKKAIEKYNINKNMCIIFEDSKSGILSAKGINPKILIGIESIYSENEIKKYGVNFSIKNYSNLNIKDILNKTSKNNFLTYFENIIKKNSIIDNIENIHVDNDRLKGGFIADVISFDITTNNKNKYSQILKYENNNKNNLSNMAKQLQLYDREYYFYTHISNIIKINIPKFYNLVFDNNNIIGVVLENLFSKNYKNNLNLNNESIDVSLKIIDRMAKMHSQFWNKDLKILYPNLKKSNDIIFYPFFTDFVQEKYELFKNRWFKILSKNQIEKCDEIYRNFKKIQESFSTGNNLTFIHGDIKSPNIFYDVDNGSEPYFIDWQHCAVGKGAQDLIFFIIESFDIINIKSIFTIAKEYYYKKIIEYGINNYSFEEYEIDIYNAICYIPFFTSIWFGTTPQDELIDKNFPYFLITKLFYLLEIL